MLAWSVTLLNLTNLRLLEAQIGSIAETPTFNPRLTRFITQLNEAVAQLIAEFDNVPEVVRRGLINQISSVVKFLAGSTSKRIPYEIAYALELALKDWMHNPAIVTTAISQELISGYYFQGVSESFYKQLEIFLNVKIEDRIVQISLPEIYRHRPLYCTPLYHELGHFIDVQFGVTSQWLLSSPSGSLSLPNLPSSLSPDLMEQFQRNHRMEYFADIFAAIYTGRCVSTFLEALTGAGQGATGTHPATADRDRMVNDLLGNVNNPILDSLTPVLQQLNLPALHVRYTPMNVIDNFNNMRPVAVSNTSELHGIFPAAWNYLKDAAELRSGNWRNMPVSEIERVVNNLVEKSIRNRMIVEKWNHESP